MTKDQGPERHADACDEESKHSAPAAENAASAAAAAGMCATQRIDADIAELGGWRSATLAAARAPIHEANPAVLEEFKWRGVPVCSHADIICTGEPYKLAVKPAAAKGISLPNPSGLFNASLDGNTRRAIDIDEGWQLDRTALKALIRALVTCNTAPKAAAT